MSEYSGVRPQVKRVVSPQGAEWETFDACVESVSEWDGIETPERVCGAWHVSEAAGESETKARTRSQSENGSCSDLTLVKRRASDKVGNALYGPVSACSLPMLADALVQFDVNKRRVYVDSPAEVPEQASVQQGQQGGLFYETGEATESAHPDTEPNPEQDIERFIESAEVEQAIAATNDEPGMGFTLHRNLEQQSLGEDDEWMVGLGGVQFDRELEKEDIVEVYEEFLPLLQAYPGVRIGGYQFEEGGTFSLDITAAVTDEEEARELGEALNQESVFNLGTQDLIMTDGSGESPLQDASPEEMGEQLSELDSLSEKERARYAKLDADQKELARQYADEKPAHDLTDVYVAEDASEARSFAEIALAAKNDSSISVEPDGEAYRVDGVLFEPASEITSEARGLNMSKDNKVYIDSTDEAPAWARVETGARGGLYYVVSFETLPTPVQQLIRDKREKIRQIIRDSMRAAQRQLDVDEIDSFESEVTDMAFPLLRGEFRQELPEDGVPADVLDEIVEFVISEFTDRLGEL